MRIISKRTLREFWLEHPDCEKQLLVWYKEIKLCKCLLAEEMLQHIPNSRSIGKNRFIFNIKGNQYRLVVRINFYLQTVWIRFIGTHQDYDKINALEI